jgi:hypothetical protein
LIVLVAYYLNRDILKENFMKEKEKRAANEKCKK